MGTGSLTDAHVSTIADAIIALRYVELGDAVRRALAVLQVRGSTHSKDIHKYIIDDSGMRIEGRLSGVALSATQSGHELLVAAQTSRPQIRKSS
jgi:KaiC/GvpD/RAD55 family RecA-like ATPase